MDTLRQLYRRQAFIDINPNKIALNPNLYDNDNIEVQYAQLIDPWRWRRGWVHALGWVFFNMGLILIFTFLYLQDRRIDRARLKVALANTETYMTMDEYAHRSFVDRMSTHIRSFSYKRTRGRWWWRGLGKMSLGMALLVLAGWAYPLLYVFTQKPYYRPFSWYGPPGLANRSGMIAIAMTPFILALGMKANLISFMTGVGHERLNVLHRWLGFLTGILAVVHTIPFLYEPVRDNGWHGLREKLLHGRGHIIYWTGFAALICLAWLCIASLRFVRQRLYESFKYAHMIAGVGYVALLFWHCNNMLSSWHYLWATLAIWITGLSYRFIVKSNYFQSRKWFSGDSATFAKLTDDGIKITITTKMKWKPGQHVFLRIPELSWIGNHPFMIASIVRDKEMDEKKTTQASSDSGAETSPNQDNQLTTAQKSHKSGGGVEEEEYNDMVLVFKPYKGFTRKAWEISRTKPDVLFKAYLDGPYGGMPRAMESFDTVLLIAGGSGITSVVAHLQDLCCKIRNGEALTTDIRIVWTVKRFESLEWFKDEISVAARSVPFGMVHCQYFVTEESPVQFPDYPISATKQWPDTPSPNTPRNEINTIQKTTIPSIPATAVTTPQYDPSQYSQYPEIPKGLSPYANYQQPQQPYQPHQPQQHSQYPQYQQYPLYPQFPQPVHNHAPVSVYSPIGINTPVDAEFYSPVSPADDKKQLLNSPADTIELKETKHEFSSEIKQQPLDAKPNSDEKGNSDLIQEIGTAMTTDQPPQHLTTNNGGQQPTKSVFDGPKLLIPEAVGQERDGIMRVQSPVPDFGDEVLIEFGRPRLREGIRPWAEEFGRRTCIYVCGPESLKVDVSNAVAGLQQDIWYKGNLDREEVYLHTETFEW